MKAYHSGHRWLKYTTSMGQLSLTMVATVNKRSFTFTQIGFSSFETFDFFVYTLIISFTVVFSVAFIKIQKKGSVLSAFWEIVKLALGKFPMCLESSSKFFSLLIIFFYYNLLIFHNTYMTTDLVTASPTIIIDNLEDLYHSPYRPIFMPSSNYMIRFKRAKSGIKRKVWEKVLRLGVNKSISRTKRDLKDIQNPKKYKTFLLKAPVNSDVENRPLKRFCCSITNLPHVVAGNVTK